MNLSGRSRATRFLSGFIFITLLAVVALTAVPYGTVEPWWEALFECAVFALGALWAIEGMIGRGWLVPGHRLFVPLLLLALYSFIQTLPLPEAGEAGGVPRAWGAISADPYETRLALFKLLALVLTGVLLLRYASSQRRYRALIYTLLGIGLASALFGLLRQTAQHSEGFLLPFLRPGSGYGQFINRNHFAFLMEMILGLILGLIFGGGARREHILLYAGVALPVWAALVLSNSRGGILAMLTQVLFLASIRILPRPGVEGSERGRPLWRRVGRSLLLRAGLVVALCVAVLAGAFWMGGESLTSRLETVSSEAPAAGHDAGGGGRRVEIWRAAWHMFADQPLAGVGINGFWAAVPRYHRASGEITPRQAHNDYLELLASGGIIGAVLGAWFLWSLARGARKGLMAPDPFRRAACLGASAGIFGVAVHSAFDFGLHITINALVFTTLVVICVADERVDSPAAEAAPRRGREARGG